MNILYIVHDNKRGGAALSFLEMIAVIKKENNVYVITPHKNGFIPQKLKEMNIPYFNAHYFWWKIALPQNKAFAIGKLWAYKVLNIYNCVESYRINKKISKMKIDIIHTNSSVINFGALLSKRTGIPHIWHLREYGEEDFGLKRVVSNRRYCKEMNAYAVNYIAISQDIKKKYSHIVDENKICQIYNGVSERYNYNKEKLTEKKQRTDFLISGNYCIEKGQVDVVNAIIELRRQGIEGFKVYFAGNGDFAEPKKLASKYQIQNYVFFCGCVDDMVQLRKKVDVEIVASKCEAFGRVTIEAMRMSNSVIGTNVGGTAELIKNGYSGFLYEAGDYLELAKYMKMFIVDEKLKLEMGRNAYFDTKNKYTPQENANAIVDIYRRIIHKGINDN